MALLYYLYLNAAVKSADTVVLTYLWSCSTSFTILLRFIPLDCCVAQEFHNHDAQRTTKLKYSLDQCLVTSEVQRLFVDRAIFIINLVFFLVSHKFFFSIFVVQFCC